MILGGTVEYFVDTVFNYPTLGRVLQSRGVQRAEQTGEVVTGRSDRQRFRKAWLGPLESPPPRTSPRDWWKGTSWSANSVSTSKASEDEPLLSLPPDGIAQRFAEESPDVAAGQTVDAIGVGLPGIINCGFIEESPNLRQLKGAHMQDLLVAALRNLRHHRPGLRL